MRVRKLLSTVVTVCVYFKKSHLTLLYTFIKIGMRQYTDEGSQMQAFTLKS